jgi:hypothetical protein
MLDVTKEEIEIEDTFLSRIDNICKFNNIKANVVNGCIRNIKHTNIAYLEPHRVIIKDKLYLYFNGSEEIFINNLNTKIRLCDLENYIQSN